MSSRYAELFAKLVATALGALWRLLTSDEDFNLLLTGFAKVFVKRHFRSLTYLVP